MSDSFCRKSISLNLLATSEIVPLRPSSACLVSKGVQREMCNLYCLKKKKKGRHICLDILYIKPTLNCAAGLAFHRLWDVVEGVLHLECQGILANRFGKYMGNLYRIH